MINFFKQILMSVQLTWTIVQSRLHALTMKAASPVHAIMATPEMAPDVMVRTQLLRLAKIINFFKQILMSVQLTWTIVQNMLHVLILRGVTTVTVILAILEMAQNASVRKVTHQAF